MIGAADDMQELVRVTVLDVRGGTVKLGFAAEDDVAVYREEVWERVSSESRATVPAPLAEKPKYRVPYIDGSP